MPHSCSCLGMNLDGKTGVPRHVGVRRDRRSLEHRGHRHGIADVRHEIVPDPIRRGG